MKSLVRCIYCGEEYTYQGDCFGEQLAWEWHQNHMETSAPCREARDLAKLQRGIDLRAEVRRLFQYLDLVETSDSGKEFRPVILSCSRIDLQEGLEACLKRMKGLIDA